MATLVPSKFVSELNNTFVLDNSRGLPKPNDAIIYRSGPEVNEVFYLENNGAGFLIVSKHDGTVLSVPEFSDGSDGTKLEFKPKNGNDLQRWIIRDEGNGSLTITAYNGKFAAVNNGIAANETNIVLASNKTLAAIWRQATL